MVLIAAFGKFALGVMMLMALGVAAMTLEAFPGSLPAAQKRLQIQTEFALFDAGADWASVTMDGQKAILRGEAPSADARDDAANILAGAVWDSGIVLGGVTTVDATAATVAEIPPQAEEVRVAANAPLPETQDMTEPLVEAPFIADPNPAKTFDTATAPTPEIQDAAEEAQEPVEIAEADAALPVDALEPEATCLDDLARITSARRITFATARSEIDAANRAHLLNIADALNNCPGATLVITGHTDSRGREARNRQLSLYRADAVAAYIRSAGVSADQLETNGIGSSEPLATNATEEGRAQNRRIEFAVSTAPREGTE